MDKTALNAYRNQQVGLVFQFHNLLPELTAQENITLPRWIGGKMNEEAQRKAKELMELLGISHRAHHLPSEMSGGEQQRVAIARAVANAPRVLLADEPTGNLDPDTARDVFHHLSTITRATNTAALVVTHNQQLALNMDGVLTIENGRVVNIG